MSVPHSPHFNVFATPAAALLALGVAVCVAAGALVAVGAVINKRG